jgi:hypothetical protein
MGPWNPWLHEPAIGKAIWELTLAMAANASLADNVRKIAILVVGAGFDAAYELYAHIAVAEWEGMKPERLAALAADLKLTMALKGKRWAAQTSRPPCSLLLSVWTLRCSGMIEAQNDIPVVLQLKTSPDVLTTQVV